MSEHTLFIIDLETTGLDANLDGIVELAAVAIRDGAIIDTFESLCWPGYDRIKEPEHHNVLKISGISPAKLLDAPETRHVIAAFCRWARRLMEFSPDVGTPPIPVTGYNVAFDRSFIETATPGLAHTFAWDQCIMARYRATIPSMRGYRYGPALQKACQWLGIEQAGAHRALADARAAAEVWLRLEARER